MLNGKSLWIGMTAAAVWSRLMRSGKVIWRSLSTRTFLLLVAAPFVAWALMLMWVRAQYADDVVLNAVAAGPGVMLLLWAVLVSAWFGLTLGVAAYRHSLAVGLAFVVLVVFGLTTMPPRAARRVHHRADTSTSMHANGVR